MVLANTPERQQSLEFASYKKILENKFMQKGFNVTDNKEIADYVAVINYGIDEGTLVVHTYQVPQRGYIGMNNYPYGYYRGYNNGLYPYQPYGNMGYTTETVTSREYNRNLSIDIMDRPGFLQANPIKFYEGKAKSSGNCGSLPGVFEPLVEALFFDFPGINGKTQIISIPWEPKC